MHKDYIEIGKIVGTHGIKGEIRLQPWCDSISFIKKFKKLYFGKDGSGEIDLLSCREHGNTALLKLQGIDTIEDAQAIRNDILYIKRSDAGLKKGTWFVQELIGCTVVDADDEQVVYGTVSDVSGTGANDVWYISKDGKETLIPAISDVVRSVDVEKGIIGICPLRGLFDDN